MTFPALLDNCQMWPSPCFTQCWDPGFFCSTLSFMIQKQNQMELLKLMVFFFGRRQCTSGIVQDFLLTQCGTWRPRGILEIELRLAVWKASTIPAACKTSTFFLASDFWFLFLEVPFDEGLYKIKNSCQLTTVSFKYNSVFCIAWDFRGPYYSSTTHTDEHLPVIFYGTRG